MKKNKTKLSLSPLVFFGLNETYKDFFFSLCCCFLFSFHSSLELFFFLITPQTLSKFKSYFSCSFVGKFFLSTSLRFIVEFDENSFFFFAFLLNRKKSLAKSIQIDFVLFPSIFSLHLNFIALFFRDVIF